MTTIIAQATPPGRGGIGIVRISGPEASLVAQGLLGRVPKPRRADYLPFYDANGQVIDQGVALFFPRPNSFTGEDVLELQGHGGPAVISLLFKRILQIPNIRIARPGEFSERAFLNGKLDLAQAEAIADLISASSEQAARCAMRSLQGEFSQQVQKLVDELIQLRISVEAAIDFPEEEIDILSETRIASRMELLSASVNSLLRDSSRGSKLLEGVRVVLAGPPNAGKSSLLNALVGDERAIVTPIAGTTRDVLHEQIHLDGIPVHIIDTAGLREAVDEIEQIGISRARQQIALADHVLLVVDSSITPTAAPRDIWPENEYQPPEQCAITVVRNKIDLTGESPGQSSDSGSTTIRLCARSGEGVELLRAHLQKSMDLPSQDENLFLARRRHLTALEEAQSHLQEGSDQLTASAASELLAESLRAAQHALGKITGEFTSDELLGEIFSNFCIGK